MVASYMSQYMKINSMSIRSSNKEISFSKHNIYTKSSQDIKYSTGDIVNNIVITMHGAR